jgi:hypothetical protein
MSRWPVYTLSIAAVAVFNPWGFAVLYAAFLSNEALSRNIWQPVVLLVALLLLGTAILEVLVRERQKKRSRQLSSRNSHEPR